MRGLVGLVEDVCCWLGDIAARGLRSRPATTGLDGAMLLGYQVSEGERVLLMDDDVRRHLYVLGATGSGKTTFLLRAINWDLARGRTVVVLDLRGDLVDRVLNQIPQHVSVDEAATRLCILDLRERKNIVGFNPLVGAGDPHTRALQVLAVLKSHSESWGVQIEETARAALIALAQSQQSLLHLDPLLTDVRYRAQILRQVTDPLVISFFDRYGALSAEKQALWVGAVLNKATAFLAAPRVRHVLSAPNSLPLKDFLDKPSRILLIALAAHELKSAAHLLGSLLVAGIEDAVTSRVNQAEGKRQPVHLYVDEFEAMASASFGTLLAEGRRFGLSLTLSHQNLSQVETHLRDVIRNNVHTQVFFQVGLSDATAIAPEILGHGSKEQVRETLMNLGVGEAFLVRRGEPTQRVQMLPLEDRPVEEAAVRVIREASMQPWAARSAPTEDRPATAEAKMEVRHERKPRLG